MANKKYTKEKLEEAAKQCTSWRQMIQYFGLKEAGGNYSNLQNRCDEFNVDTTHFTGQGWNKIGHPSFGNSIDLTNRLCKHEKKKSSTKTKLVLLNHNLKENKCEICGISEWLGNPITIQLHHINGDPTDDRLENLQMLCPNCHTQTDTYCKRQEIRVLNLSAQEEILEVEELKIGETLTSNVDGNPEPSLV